MEEERFSRLESRVDEIKDDVSELKVEQKIQSHSLNNLTENLKEHTEYVKGHVTSDNKIINQIGPLLESLPALTDMVKDHEFKKKTYTRRKEKLKYLILNLTIVTSIVGIIVGIYKIS